MRTTLCLLSGLIACATMIAGCATSPPEPVRPPRLTIPEAAKRSCALSVLPYNPTQADLDAGYMTRGAQIVTCDGARALAIESIEAERRLIDEWLKIEARRRQGWLDRIVPG